MLTHSDFPIVDALQFFTHNGVEVGFLSPTETGLQKSILDAHESLRSFLQSAGIHDYGTQEQGPESKVVISGHLVSPDRLIPTQISLYRPQTKRGDPRIWISGLGSYAHAGNLLALFLDPSGSGSLIVANVSDIQIWSSRGNPNSPLGRLLSSRPKAGSDSRLDELLAMLLEVNREGWVPSLRTGSTGVGFTLESRLGIAANSRKAPDFHGIEIKAGRVKSVEPF